MKHFILDTRIHEMRFTLQQLNDVTVFLDSVLRDTLALSHLTEEERMITHYKTTSYDICFQCFCRCVDVGNEIIRTNKYNCSEPVGNIRRGLTLLYNLRDARKGKSMDLRGICGDEDRCRALALLDSKDESLWIPINLDKAPISIDERRLFSFIQIDSYLSHVEEEEVSAEDDDENYDDLPPLEECSEDDSANQPVVSKTLSSDCTIRYPRSEKISNMRITATSFLHYPIFHFPYDYPLPL